MKDETIPINFASQDDLLKDLGGPGAQNEFLSQALKMLLTPEQLEELKKKFQPPAPKPAEKPRVIWSVGTVQSTGQAFLCAAYYRGHGLMDRLYFTSRPAKLTKFRMAADGKWEPFKSHNEVVPAEYVREYTKLFESGPAVPITAPTFGGQPPQELNRFPERGSYAGAIPQSFPERYPRRNYKE